ncbi:MAG: sugar ABC transporter permease [Anaerolineaceae bacterium]|nr:sugar ABC transporter permease [Anaerolineaceae bacterium]
MMMKKRSKNGRVIRNSITGYLFVLPSFAGFAIFMLIPILYGFYVSLTNYNGFNKFDFIGLQNYINMFHDTYFLVSLKNNLLYAIVTVPLTIVLALLLAVAVKAGVKGSGIFKSMYFFPQVCSYVAVGIVWGIIFSSNGPLNLALKAFGAENVPTWLQTSKWALWAIMLVAIWKKLGYYMIMLLAGMQAIPKYIYEAASVDGANSVVQFFKITLPMLSPTMFMVIIFSIIDSFQVFDLVSIMTNGGPGTATNVLVFRIYQEGFKNLHYGYAAAMAYFLFAVILVITIIQFKFQAKYSVD